MKLLPNEIAELIEIVRREDERNQRINDEMPTGARFQYLTDTVKAWHESIIVKLQTLQCKEQNNA